MNLPEPAAQEYAQLKKKYALAFETLRLRGLELKLLQVTDLTPFVAGKDIFKDVSSFPTWVKLWEAAMVLADVVAGLDHQPGDTLLELGCGLGASGLAAAANGFQVTLSDYQEEILSFPRVSAAASGLANVDFALLDWRKPSALPAFNTIIGAEILFRDDLFAPLLNLFDRFLAPNGSIYLSHDARRKSLPRFLMQAESRYEIAFSTRTMSTEGEKLTIIVNRLRVKEGV